MHCLAALLVAILGLSQAPAAPASTAPVPAPAPAPTPPAPDTAHFGDRAPKLGIGDQLPIENPFARLRVGVADLPPWTVPPTAGTPYWSGLASLVWREVSESLRLDYEVKAYDYEGLLAAASSGEVDVAVAGIPIVPDNLVRFTMTPPFDQSGLSIATRIRSGLSFGNVFDRLAGPEVARWLLAILGSMFVFAFLFWLAERRRNPPIEGNPARGLAESAWWSVVTLSTVGYGDRVPVTRTGKLIGALWMAFGFVLMTVSAGVVTSILTVDRLRPVVAGPSELARSRVGVVAGTTGDAYVQAVAIAAERFDTFEDAIDALADQRVEAVVGSTTTLTYLTERSGHRHLMVLPRALLRDYVGFAVRFGMDPALEKRIALEVVKAAQGAEYRAMRALMLGDIDTATDSGPQPGG
jgi:ABC-type amino acid transport substrate-binding protein